MDVLTLRTGQVLLFALLAAVALCPPSDAQAPHHDPPGKPELALGFNVKGNLNEDSTLQCEMLDKELTYRRKDGFPADKIWLRLQGGTPSQRYLPSDWSDKTIGLWAGLQKKFGFKCIFVVNFNDSPKSQAAFFDRWAGAGVRYELIELGNEHYLPKFRLSKTEMPEVTARTSGMNARKYIGLCNEYIAALEHHGLPFCVQFAPEKESLSSSDWNIPVAEAINSGAFASGKICASLHLYEKGPGGSLDAAQIGRTRGLVKKPIRIAITESGVTEDKFRTPGLFRDRRLYEEFIGREQKVFALIAGHLLDGDILLNQVLYTDFKKGHEANFHPDFKGITPKGRAFFETFADRFKRN